MALASAVLLPRVFFMKSVHAFLLGNAECQASTDSKTKVVDIIPPTAIIPTIRNVKLRKFMYNKYVPNYLYLFYKPL